MSYISMDVVFPFRMYPLPNPLARVSVSEQLTARQNHRHGRLGYATDRYVVAGGKIRCSGWEDML